MGGGGGGEGQNALFVVNHPCSYSFSPPRRFLKSQETHQNKTLTPTNSKSFLGEQGKGECSVTTDQFVGGKIIRITKTKCVHSQSCLLIASNPVTSISDHFKTSLPVNAPKQFH